MTNSTRIYDHPTDSTVTLDHARSILTAHGYSPDVHDLGTDGVALYMLTPWGTEHVQDTETGRIHVSHLRTALGY